MERAHNEQDIDHRSADSSGREMIARNDVYTLAADIFDDPEIWLETPNINLGGNTPYGSMAEGRTDAVVNLLGLIKHVGFS